MQSSYSTHLALGMSPAHARVERALTVAFRRTAKPCTNSQAITHLRPRGTTTIAITARRRLLFLATSQPEGSAVGGTEVPTPTPSLSATHRSPTPEAPSPAPSLASPSSPTVDSNHDDFAKAWRPPPGEPPLWWVEKFEARRKAEAKRKAEDPTFVSTLETIQANDEEGRRGNPALRFFGAVLQVVQLIVVLTLLLLLPAGLHDGGLSLDRPFTTFAAYLLFFGLGSVARVVRYGKLVPRKSDRQVATWGGRLALAGFVTVLPLLHWYAMYRYVALSLYTQVIPASATLYDVIGAVGMVAATLLNATASRELGGAYDRLSAPATLVTSGPYKMVQHPIYASYILLFFSYGMWLHSATAALAMLLVCVIYYRSRTALEAGVLEEAFGEYYRDYAARTKKFIPFLL